MWMVAGLTAIGQTMLDLGARVDLGAGIEAAMASLAAAPGGGAPA
jgi:hypothetical protein